MGSSRKKMERRAIFLDRHPPLCCLTSKLPFKTRTHYSRRTTRFLETTKRRNIIFTTCQDERKTTTTTNGNTRRSCIRGSKRMDFSPSCTISKKNARKKYHERGQPYFAVCIITPERP